MSSSVLSGPTPDLSAGVFTDTTPRDTAVSVRGLSKSYSIARNAATHTTAREALLHTLTHPFQKVERDTFWALKDVDFDIQKGDVVGIIGRNGRRQKSTLLKILSAASPNPPTGQIDIYGRVGSLLEVGTGFHPELTGRENIFLNGAILGMKKSEIARQFDAIVEFAEVAQFLDTPVKRYSSGMYVRLAFAVAAHLHPEILIIDEVLAVGDAQFQKKCLGKMQDVADSGRTVLFVSHNMPMIMRLCKQAILLKGGRVVAFGGTHKVTDRYVHSDTDSPAERIFTGMINQPGDDVARLRAVRVKDHTGNVAETVDIRDPFCVEVEYENLQTGSRPTAILHFINEEGICLFATNDFNNREWWKTPRRAGIVKAVCNIPAVILLAEGRLFLLVALGTYNPNAIHALVRDVVSFQVVDQSEGDGVRGEASVDWPGVMRPMLDWEISQDR